MDHCILQKPRKWYQQIKVLNIKFENRNKLNIESKNPRYVQIMQVLAYDNKDFITLTSLSHYDFVPVPSQNFHFQRLTSRYFCVSGERWLLSFLGIGGNVDHNCLKILFIICIVYHTTLIMHASNNVFFTSIIQDLTFDYLFKNSNENLKIGTKNWGCQQKKRNILFFGLIEIHLLNSLVLRGSGWLNELGSGNT